MKFMIVDDEPLAIKVLKNHLEQIPGTEVVGAFTGALDAFDQLRRVEVDVLLLDIQMPGLTGVDLVRALDAPPPIIFTTAYRDYAVEGFELEAVDYLLKPISLPRLLKAIEKVRRLQGAIHDPERAGGTEGSRGSGTLNVRADREVVKIAIDEIVYAESLGDYVTIHLPDRRVTTKKTISQFEEQLVPFGFLRIHRSFLVRKGTIRSFSNDHVNAAGKELPIGRTFRREVMRQLGECR